MLDGLDDFLGKQERNMLSRLSGVDTPDAAFAVACEYRALVKFVTDAKATVAIGEAAARELMTEE